MSVHPRFAGNLTRLYQIAESKDKRGVGATRPPAKHDASPGWRPRGTLGMRGSMAPLRDALKITLGADRVKHARIPEENAPCRWTSPTHP